VDRFVTLLARKLNEPPRMSNRLATIASAQKQARRRDVLFACFIALAAALAATSVSGPSTPSSHVVER
jgi:NaMN:DMB phosphoribosyltransferase